MDSQFLKDKQRQRAPSKRALETRTRIMDAAERVFARDGYDAATIRNIAAEADVQGALVNHHGGSKEELFWRVVARRAEVLSDARLAALEARKAQGPLNVEAVLVCFFAPFLEHAEAGDPQWLAYARLVAIVSTDLRWSDLAAVCFDPTANRFLQEIKALYPEAPHATVASTYVYSVAGLLALITTKSRMDALGDDRQDSLDRLSELIRFCAAGIAAAVASAG